MIVISRLAYAFFAASVLTSAGCGKKEDAKKPTTQVAASVNGEEITIHQVNSVLARTPNIAPDAAERAKREILDKLIDQQLAKQKALERKLDQSPGVVQMLEAARSEILARAYLDQVAAALPRSSAEEVKKYYADHPELFARRRIFSLEEITLVAADDVHAKLRERIAKARSMQEIAEWLQSQGVKFVPNRGVRAAEQLPLDLLPKLHGAKDGEILVLDSQGGSRQVVRIVASKEEPVDEAAATPRIQQFLANRRSGEAITADMKQIKSQAKIEYLGEFAGDAAAAQAKAKAAEERRTQAEAVAKAKAEAEAQARAAEISKARAAAEAKAKLEAELNAKSTPSKTIALPQQSIEKGVGGLK